MTRGWHLLRVVASPWLVGHRAQKPTNYSENELERSQEELNDEYRKHPDNYRDAIAEKKPPRNSVRIPSTHLKSVGQGSYS